ncbi:hypothetical protein HW114_08320 [Serratia symbiotica]|nr:hypothetical protein [Serratia symbiotica]QTP15097.1 hypothetical protein GPZ83_0003730 [Serratia symbiotica]
MTTVTVHCPRCDPDDVYRQDFSPTKHERLRCQSCRCVFQLNYTYQAWKPGLKEHIVDMTFNGAGVGDTARTHKVGINTVIPTLKISRPRG